ncbi:MAG: NADPH-dependent F420 reductase [Acidobacteria bacterium]|nr:NADPH-dependent F420 reductase [Acidobacteriota bacterium]
MDPIAILGAGQVGSALGRQWAGKGRRIIFGARDPQSAKVLALTDSIGPRSTAVTVREAVASAEMVLIATPWSKTREALDAAGDLDGKILMDATNPLAPDLSGLTVGHTSSAAEQIAHWAPGSSVVKAFNCIGAKSMSEPRFGSMSASMFICGDAEEAKSRVARLTEEIGFEVIDAGPLSNARLLEPLAMLWIDLALKRGLGPDIGFKILRR